MLLESVRTGRGRVPETSRAEHGAARQAAKDTPPGEEMPRYRAWGPDREMMRWWQRRGPPRIPPPTDEEPALTASHPPGPQPAAPSGQLSGSRPVLAPRGTGLSCKGWPQEAARRMLMNNLGPEGAERPDQLIVYGGSGRAARSGEALDGIVR